MKHTYHICINKERIKLIKYCVGLCSMCGYRGIDVELTESQANVLRSLITGEPLDVEK